MLIERNYAGAWVISAMVAGYLVTRQYMGYTKPEAVRMFRAENKVQDILGKGRK